MHVAAKNRLHFPKPSGPLTLKSCLGRHAAFLLNGPTFQPFTHGFHTSPQNAGPYTVVVPSMGESITEGSIGGIAKNPGYPSFQCYATFG